MKIIAMGIPQNRIAIQALEAGISDLVKKQSRERENLSKYEAKASECRRKLSASNKNTPLSTIQSLERQYIAAVKDSAKVSSVLSNLQEKILQKNKELNRHKTLLEKEIEQENKKYLAEEKKLLKQRDERHKEDIKRLKELQSLIDSQNRLRSAVVSTSPFYSPQEPSLFRSETTISIFDKIEKMDEKLNLVMQTLEKLGFGQEIIFDELDEMKNLPALTPKTWFQILKGKLLDLALKKAIDIAVIPKILNLFPEEDL